MSHRTIAVVALGLTVFAAGCVTTDPTTGERRPNRAATGAIIGALGGAAVGAATNTSDGEETRKNAAIGAGVGAIAGAAVGGYMDQQERILRERLAQSQVQVQRTAENEILLNMPSDITFAVDSATVQPQFIATLNTVAQTLQEYPSTLIDIIGHADSTGADDYNMGLSQRRAQSVANALTDRGVQPARIVSQGRGETQPVADNATVAGRQQNRRVEVRLRPITT
jgi:outer membrane protein OmpA-like peptidoglycan-associated protein